MHLQVKYISVVFIIDIRICFRFAQVVNISYRYNQQVHYQQMPRIRR